MSMQQQSTAQTINLWSLEQGQEMTVVITNAPSDCQLEFLHAEDATWRVHPGFAGAAASGVIVESVQCLSGKMRIVFDDEPVTPYFISLVWAAAPIF